jgi:hypothetical protein
MYLCTFDNLSKSLPYLEIPLLIQQQKCNQQDISTVDNTKSVLENKSVTCIKDKEKNIVSINTFATRRLIFTNTLVI